MSIPDPLAHILKCYCNVNGFTKDWGKAIFNQLKRKGDSYEREFKEQLGNAIAYNTISLQDYERLTGEDFDTPEELNQWLKTIWKEVFILTDNPTEKFKELAELVKNEFNLEYDQKAVEFLEGFIERQRERWINNSKKPGLINSIGSFLGECLIQNYGGIWEEDKETGWCVKFPGGEKAFPFNKVKKQFDNDIGDSILSFYKVLPTLLKK